MAAKFSSEGGADDIPEPPRLRQLRLLVNALTLTLTIGFIIIVVALLIRLGRVPAPVALPESVTLPSGETARAVTLGGDWVALVTEDSAGRERVRLFDRVSGAPRGEMNIAAEPDSD
jgi:hypothetical protein